MEWETTSLKSGDLVLIKGGQVIKPEISGDSNVLKESDLKRKQFQEQKNAIYGRKVPPEKEALKRLQELQQEFEIWQTRISRIKNLTPKEAEKTTTKLTAEIQNRVKYILSSRSKVSIPSNYGSRTSTIQDSINMDIIQIGENLTPKIRREWRELQNDFEKFSPVGQQLNVIQKQPVLDESNLGVPLNLAGTFFLMIRRPPRSTLFHYNPLLMI